MEVQVQDYAVREMKMVCILTSYYAYLVSLMPFLMPLLMPFFMPCSVSLRGSMSEIVCSYCRGKGHRSKQCPNKDHPTRHEEFSDEFVYSVSTMHTHRSSVMNATLRA